MATLAILTALAMLLTAGAFRRRDGMVFFLGIGLWAVARAAVSTTWRDPAEIGRLPGGGVLAMGIASVCVLALVALLIRARMVPRAPTRMGGWGWHPATPPIPRSTLSGT